MKHAIILACLVVVGCASGPGTTDIVSSWVGKPYSALVSRWGSPDQASEMPDGSHVIAYRWEQDSLGVMVPVYTQRCNVLFHVIDGRVTGYKWNGDVCGYKVEGLGAY